MAPQKQAELDRQTQRIQQLDAQAQQLKAPARLPRQQAIALLESTAGALLGEGVRLQVQGDQVQLTLKAAPASGLAQWLTQAREKAQALPHSVRLQRTAPAREAVSGNTPETLWSGEMTLRLP
jgi:general secretion pathway protein M